MGKRREILERQRDAGRRRVRKGTTVSFRSDSSASDEKAQRVGLSVHETASRPQDRQRALQLVRQHTRLLRTHHEFHQSQHQSAPQSMHFG